MSLRNRIRQIPGVTTPPIEAALALKADKAANLADLDSASEARDHLGLGSAAIKATGTTEGTVPLIGAGDKINPSILPIPTYADLSAANAAIGAIGIPFFNTANARYETTTDIA